MIVSRAHHVRTVCLTVRPKNSLNSQKPGSFGGLKMSEPAPVARTISSGLAPVTAQIGAAIPPAVRAATVAEPQAVRMTAATSQARSSGDKSEPATRLPMYVPTPLSIPRLYVLWGGVLACETYYARTLVSHHNV